MNEREAFEYIDSSTSLRSMLDVLSGASQVALDTEANSLHNYFDKVCLIQLSHDDDHFIIDPLANFDLDPFTDWLQDRTLILHGADFDLRMLRSSFGYRPRKGVFDTMLAAQLLNYERFGLGALVEQFCDIALPKTSQKSNWARRPLSQEQLRYASDDTRYLGTIVDILKEELESKGRLDWHTEWCNRIIDVTETDIPRDPDRVWRIKGLNGLNRRQLAFVRALWHWRDKEAQKIDRPAFKVMANQQLIDVAVHTDNDATYLSNGHARLPKNCTGERLIALQAAVNDTQDLAESKFPPLRLKQEKRTPIPDTKALIESLKKGCGVHAKKLDLTPSVLAPRAALTAIARNHVLHREDVFEDCGLMDWQINEVRSEVTKVLSKAS